MGVLQKKKERREAEISDLEHGGHCVPALDLFPGDDDD